MVRIPQLSLSITFKIAFGNFVLELPNTQLGEEVFLCIIIASACQLKIAGDSNIHRAWELRQRIGYRWQVTYIFVVKLGMVGCFLVGTELEFSKLPTVSSVRKPHLAPCRRRTYQAAGNPIAQQEPTGFQFSPLRLLTATHSKYSV
jgi:hypothetical protein